MTDKKERDRYYTKEDYEPPMSGLICASAFVFVGILSLIFLRLNIHFISLSSWGYWLFIPAFFMFIGGFNQIYTNSKLKKAVHNTLLDRGPGTYQLEDIALDVGIKPKNLLKILVDLRTAGKISYRFDSDSGEIEYGQKIAYSPATEYVPPKKIQEPLKSEGKRFCVYCGHNLEGDAKFCPSCGSKLL